MIRSSSPAMGLVRTCTQRVSPRHVNRDSHDQGSPRSTAARHDASVSMPRPSLTTSAQASPLAAAGAPPVVVSHTGLA